MEGTGSLDSSYCVLAAKALSGRLNCSTVLSGERIICAVDHLLQDVVWRTWVPGRQNRESTKDLASEAGKAYADYMLKQRIVDQGVKSASGRHGGSFWVPTAFGKGIRLGTGIDAGLSR